MPLAPEKDVVQLGPVKAFITHGHLYNVSYGRVDSLVYAAQEAGRSLPCSATRIRPTMSR